MALRPSRDDDDIIDFVEGEESEGRAGQGPLLLSIALGLAMVVAILVTGWYLFADSRGPGTTAGGVPVVQADPAAIKAKPTDPGGMEVPNQDKLVYERLGHNDDKPQGERLLPPPEKPQSPPKPDPAKMSLATPKPETLTPEPPPAEPAKAEVKPEPAKPEPPKQEAKPAPKPNEPPAATPAPQQQVAVAPAPETGKLAPPQPLKSETKTAAATPAPAQETGKLQKPAEKAAPAATPAPSIPPTKMAKGDFQIQLAALRDIETAQREWSKIAAANKDVLSGLAPDIVRADLGPKGIFFRLRAGSLDEVSARRVCDELGKRKIGCMVVHK